MRTPPKKALILFFVLFSVGGVIADPFKTELGYSAIWLIVLYCIGVLAKRVKLFEKRKSITLLLLWACCILFTWGKHVFGATNKYTNYVSPSILLCGMIMVVLFSRLKLKGTVISKLSPLAFGIYLFQLNQVVWNILIKNAFTFVIAKRTRFGVIYVFALSALIFVVGLTVEFIRSKIAAWIRIPAISKKIVKLIDKCLQKLFIFLK